MSKNLKRILFVGASVLAGLSLSMGVSNASSIVNQHRNALTSYIKTTHFHFVKNAKVVTPDNYSDHYNQNVDPDRTFKAVGGNYRVNYKPYATLEDQAGSYNPQSVAIDNNGTTYVSYRLGQTNKVQIARYPSISNVSDGELQHVHYGPIFHGGHGQAMALNPKTDQLWLLYNLDGSASHTKLFEISKTTLQPIRQINFHMSPYAMGDTLAFDDNGNAYMCVRTFSGAAPVGSLKLFKGKITNNSVKFHMVQGLRYAPNKIMQNMSYNPANNRVYFIGNGEYMSVPANHYDHLKPSDVQSTQLNGHYEFEDLAFYHGKGYLLVHYPSELMVSDNSSVSQPSTNKTTSHKKVAKKSNKKSAKKNGKKVNKHANKKANKKVNKHNNKRQTKKHNKKAVRRHERKNNK